MVFPTLINSTNQSIEGVFTLVISNTTVSPDLMYIAPAVIIVGFFCLFLYMAETRRDIGYAVFMALTSIFAFNNALISTVKYGNVSGFQPNLPFIMLLLGGYEIFMTLLLINELRNRTVLGRE